MTDEENQNPPRGLLYILGPDCVELDDMHFDEMVRERFASGEIVRLTALNGFNDGNSPKWWAQEGCTQPHLYCAPRSDCKGFRGAWGGDHQDYTRRKANRIFENRGFASAPRI
jgi:hypothetical protein